MPNTLKINSLKNSTGLTLDFFHQFEDGEVQTFAPGEHKLLCPPLEVPICGENYDPEGDVPPYLCLRDKNGIHERWLRIFVDADTHNSSLISVHDNRWAARQVISTTVKTGLQPGGLYLEAKMQDIPDAAKVLWIVGELVTDVYGDDPV